MKYIGLQAQQSSNNMKSILLLLMFPVLILFLIYVFFFILFIVFTDAEIAFEYANYSFVNTILDKLDDDELEGIIAQKLSHIRNRDVRLLIISIVFVGILSLLVKIALRSLRYTFFWSIKKGKVGALVIVLLVLVLAATGYFFSHMFKLAISRKLEYLADASVAEMTHKPWALASALRKVSQDSHIEAVKQADVAQLFIEHPGDESQESRVGFSGLFATHPPIKKRIKILEQFG